MKDFEIIVCLLEKRSNWLVIRVLSLIPLNYCTTLVIKFVMVNFSLGLFI